MPTLAELLTFPGLGLKVLVGEDQLDREIRWVATSEHPDPTPFLRGGELLLTTGMRLERNLDAVRAFAARLRAAGVVAIGYGVGVVSDEVPRRLQRAAAEHDLVVLEVDAPTPFIAITQAVSEMQATRQYAEVARGYQAQQDITRAAVRGGFAGVVRSLARSLDGWVLLLDRRGAVLQSFPVAAQSHAAALRPELERLRSSGVSALSLAQAGGHVSVHPIGTGARVHTFLAAGTPRTPTSADRALLRLSEALLAVVGNRDDDRLPRRRAAALLSVVRRGEVTDPRTLIDLGATILRNARVHVRAVSGGRAEIERWARHMEALGTDDCLVAATGETGWAVSAGTPSHDVTAARTEDASRGLQTGLSEPCPPERLGAALEQAGRALAVARQRNQPVVRYADIIAGPIGLADPADAAAYAERLLQPLRTADEAGGAELLTTLRAWLAHHGQLGPAATELGVHRHTMRHRVRRAEALLGRSLEDADSRMELWFALRVVQDV